MNARRLSAVAVAAVLALAPSVSSAQTPAPTSTPAPTASPSSNVQGQQNSSDARSESGSASGSNSSNINNGGGNRMQHGSNSTTVRQSGSATAGDSVAGSQVTGVNGPNATISNVNNSDNAHAIGGSASIDNNVDARLGPFADLLGSAAVFQTGNNDLTIEQAGSASTGDAVANSQITGIVGSGNHTVLNSNNANCEGLEACGQSGDADVLNFGGGSAGPSAVSANGDASASQSGNNTVHLIQAAETSTGDGVDGSSILGSVGGSIVASGVNTSTCEAVSDGGDPIACAASGDSSANSLGSISSGAFASADGFGSATQSGSNASYFDQIADAVSGDGVSGSQVTGVVGPGNAVLIGTNSADGAFGTSGDADSSIDVAFFAGAQSFGFVGASSQQTGDNVVDGAQASNGATGDAVAGTQIASGVGLANVSAQLSNVVEGIRAFSGNFVSPGAAAAANGTAGTFALSGIGGGTASSTQSGNNDGIVSQDVNFKTGDGVAGGQIAGFVDVTESASIQANNLAEDVFGSSGSAEFQNEIGLNSGTVAISDDTASANQTGNNTADTRQALSGSTGDAVGGGQIFGIVGDADTNGAIQATNSCEGNGQDEFCDAVSGDALTSNLGTVSAGARTTSFVDGSTLSTQQTGDNSVISSQSVESSTGDAAAGSQVSGAVLGGDFSAQMTANSEFAAASSGLADSMNDLEVYSGPTAENDLLTTAGNASVTQSGDNYLEYLQDSVAESGDAVAGAQVSGISGAKTSSVQNSGTNSDAFAFSNNSVAANAIAGAMGPVANALLSNSTQNGNSSSDGSQSIGSNTGDAIAGGQVSGTVSFFGFLSFLNLDN